MPLYGKDAPSNVKKAQCQESTILGCTPRRLHNTILGNGQSLANTPEGQSPKPFLRKNLIRKLANNIK